MASDNTEQNQNTIWIIRKEGTFRTYYRTFFNSRNESTGWAYRRFKNQSTTEDKIIKRPVTGRGSTYRGTTTEDLREEFHWVIRRNAESHSKFNLYLHTLSPNIALSASKFLDKIIERRFNELFHDNQEEPIDWPVHAHTDGHGHTYAQRVMDFIKWITECGIDPEDATFSIYENYAVENETLFNEDGTPITCDLIPPTISTTYLVRSEVARRRFLTLQDAPLNAILITYAFTDNSGEEVPTRTIQANQGLKAIAPVRGEIWVNMGGNLIFEATDSAGNSSSVGFENVDGTELVPYEAPVNP